MQTAIWSLILLATSATSLVLRMGLDPNLSKSFPRDFKTIPLGIFKYEETIWLMIKLNN